LSLLQKCIWELTNVLERLVNIITTRLQEAPNRLSDCTQPSTSKPQNFWSRRAIVNLFIALEFSLCGVEGLHYVKVDLMSLVCSGLTLCYTSLGQTFGEKYGSTLCHPCVVGQLYVSLTLCQVNLLYVS
jgi:hypothetical protein